MKRAIILIALVVMTFFGVRYVETSAPIMPIVGTSMEPMLKLGDLIVIGSVDPPQVKEGDVIVFNVPGLIREKYNYPAVVAHRVIKVINDSGSISFRTKGDNTGEDPFTVLSSDLRGQVVKQISHGGYLPLFLQSKQGMYFMVIVLILLAIYFYGGDIQQKWQKTRRSFLAPVFEENQKIVQRQNEVMEMSAKSLQQFSDAMSEYAKHLASHTAAIQGLASASQELRDAAREQNKMFASWRGPGEKTQKEITDISSPPGCYRQAKSHEHRERRV